MWPRKYQKALEMIKDLSNAPKKSEGNIYYSKMCSYIEKMFLSNEFLIKYPQNWEEGIDMGKCKILLSKIII